MTKELSFCFIRAQLFNNVYDERVKKEFYQTKNELKKRISKNAKFMLHMMNLAEDEISNGNLKLAGYDIDLLHNLPEMDSLTWDDTYFFSVELIGYYEDLIQERKISKVKKVMKLVGEFLV
jgi:hypothetical protein